MKSSVEAILLWESLYCVGRGIITKIKKKKAQFEVIVWLLENHNAFDDIKLPIPLDGLTFIRECIEKHLKWNSYDLRPFESLPWR